MVFPRFSHVFPRFSPGFPHVFHPPPDPRCGPARLGEVQDETSLRLRRLLRHGDLRGAQRALQRAKLLNMETKEEEETVTWLRGYQPI